MRTVLIVDDDAVFRSHMLDLLSRAGYAVHAASDAHQALKLIGQMRDSLDFAIVDLVLPDQSGYEIIGLVAERAPNVKLIATTGLLKYPYLESAKACGAHATLDKTADDSAWLTTMDNLLRAAEGPG